MDLLGDLNMADSTPLKPCPFCGASAKLFSCIENECFKIRCEDGCCKMPSSGCFGVEYKAQLIEEWNARV